MRRREPGLNLGHPSGGSSSRASYLRQRRQPEQAELTAAGSSIACRTSTIFDSLVETLHEAPRKTSSSTSGESSSTVDTSDVKRVVTLPLFFRSHTCC